MKYKILITIAFALVLSGCPTSQLREGTFFYTGYRVTAEAVDHSQTNRNVAIHVDRAINLLLGEDSIPFELIEQWYADRRQELDIHIADLILLESVFIRPMWADLKEKYGGKTLYLTDPQVVKDIRAFQRGVRLALDTNATD